VNDVFAEPDGATPLEPEERDGLLQSWITHRRDLNEAEEENILACAVWAQRLLGRKKTKDILSIKFALDLHKRMFGNVWKWAGTCRTTARNIGVDAYRIHAEMAALFGDVCYWVEHKTYPTDEIAVRLHHRLVAIHPFPNGNGRHARLMADLLVEWLGGQPFSWGSGSLADVGELRTKYIEALRAADRHDIRPLLAFARS
jgi:mobile mystery protein B